MITISPIGADGVRKGCYKRVLADEFSDAPRWSAVVFCPECGRGLSLVNHAIAADGTVTPSIGHPDSYRKADGSLCEWHPHARLADWNNAPPPKPHPSSTCARCGVVSRNLSGWGTDGRYLGIICPACITGMKGGAR